MMKSLILASGFGTRLYPLTIERSKCLLEYQGKALISHIVDKIPQDIDILVNTNKKFEPDFRDWQNTINRDVILCVEPVLTEEQSFGAVGSMDYWIRNRNIKEDLLVIAGDNYFEFDLCRFIADYNDRNVLVAVCDIGDKEKASKFGVVQLQGQKITDFEEKPAEPECSLIATACYIFPQRIFPLLSEYCAQGRKDNLGSFIAHLADVDEVHAYVFSEPWLDIGSFDTNKLINSCR